MGPKDPIYSDDVEYQTSPRATTESLSPTRCSQRNDDPTPIGWRQSSRKIPRMLDRRAPVRILQASTAEDVSEHDTRRPSRAHTSVPGTRPQQGNNLGSSHGSSQRNHDLGGSCSGLGPTGPKALLRPNPNELAEDHANQRVTVVPDVLPEVTCSTSTPPARHPAVQLDMLWSSSAS